jgi:hypothetical protein
MIGDFVLFVSKRLQRPAAALLCLMAAQLVVALAQAGESAPAPMAVRVAIRP